jgi:hypothetical protein
LMCFFIVDCRQPRQHFVAFLGFARISFINHLFSYLDGTKKRLVLDYPCFLGLPVAAFRAAWPNSVLQQT